MLIQRLHVKHWAGLNPGVKVERFHDGITLIHGANEAGKSTMLRAMAYALYQRHGVGGGAVSAELVPVGTAVAPRVELDFTVNGDAYRICKQFVKKAHSQLYLQNHGEWMPRAEGDEADDMLRRLLGNEFAAKGISRRELWGLGEVLLVDQGGLQLSSLGSPAKDRLRTILSQVSVSASSSVLMQRVDKLYDGVFTPSGELKRGQQAGAAVRLSVELENVSNEIRKVEQRLEEAANLERMLAEAGAESFDPEQRAGLVRELEAAISVKQKAALASGELKLAEAQAAAAHEEWQRQEKVLVDVSTSRVKLAELRQRVEDQTAAVSRCAEELHHARTEHGDRQRDVDALVDMERQVKSAEQQTRDAEEAARIHESMVGIKEALSRYKKLTDEWRVVDGHLRGRARPTRAEANSIREDVEALRDVERSLQALELRVRVKAVKDLEVQVLDQRAQVVAGTSQVFSGSGPLKVHLPGVATLTVEGPSLPQRAELLERQQRILEKMRRVDDTFGTHDLAALEQLEQERQKLEEQRRILEATRQSLAKDEEAHERLRTQLDEAQERLAVLFAEHTDWKRQAPSGALIQSLQKAATERRKALDALRLSRTGALKLAQQRVVDLEEILRVKEKQLNQAHADLAVTSSQVEALTADKLGDDERAERARRAQTRCVEHEAAVARAREALESHGDPDQDVQRVQQQLVAWDQQKAHSKERKDRLLGQLEMLRAEGLWQQLNELRERLAHLQQEHAREALRADAIKLLRQSLVDEKKRTLDALAKPVQDRVERMLREVVGSSVRARFAEVLLPVGLQSATAGDVVALEQLSVGTQDQLSLLTRLALGEIHAEHHGRHAMIMDDPLVNSDSVRRGRLVEVLRNAAEKLQVIIFTCHPEHYAGLTHDDCLRLEMQELKETLVVA